MFSWGILLLISVLQLSAESVSLQLPKHQCIADSGKTYTIGSVFTDNNCTARCECLDDGIISCQPMCLVRKKDKCPNPKIVRTQVGVPDAQGKSCSCPSFICEHEPMIVVQQCIDGEKTYNPGNRFISSDCSGFCRCNPGGGVSCTSLCPPVLVRCGIDEERIKFLRTIPNSNCTCPQWRCVKREQKEYCEMLPGERHKIGEFFETKDCGGYCQCTSSDSVGCVSLCPPRGIFCLPGTRKVRTVRPAFPGSKCTCPSWKCVKAYANSPAAPCDLLRINSVKDDIWPRCDDQGYFEPLQCDPSRNECWCVDKFGNVEPGSRRISQKPQCGYNHANTLEDSSTS